MFPYQTVPTTSTATYCSPSSTLTSCSHRSTRCSATNLFPGSSISTTSRYQVVPRFLQLIAMFRYQTVPTTFTATDYSHVSDRRPLPSLMFRLCHYLNPEVRQKIITWIKRTSPNVPTSCQRPALYPLPMFGLCHYLNPEAQRIH